MSATDVKDIARRLIEEDLNTGDPEAARRIVAPDFYDHTNPPHLQHGLEGHLGVVDLFHTAFPDVRWTIDDMLAEDDRVAMRLTMRGTHRGDFFGIPPTGRPVEVGGTHVVRIRDGWVVEHWGHNDDLGLMRQLGVTTGEG
jgi:steroid delta-isomerase-like uncharacterized protein